jgi:hypothetical protein
VSQADVAQAVRDAIEALGESGVIYREPGVVDRSISVRFAFGVNTFDHLNFPRRINLLRVMHADVQPLTKAGRFIRSTGEIFEIKEVLKDDKISILAEITKAEFA